MKTGSKKSPFSRYIILLFFLFIYAVNYNLFLKPLDIVAGGTNGITLVVQKYFEIDTTVFMYSFYIITFILAIIFLGYREASSALIATLVYPFFVFITKDISNLSIFSQNDIIASSIFAGVLNGLVYGYICKINMSQGGTVLICQILYEKFKISVSQSNLIINTLIVLSGAYLFGINSVLYSIILIFISSKVQDKILLGISNNKIFYIVTDEEDKIRHYLVDKLGKSVTIFDVENNDMEERKTIMISVSNILYRNVLDTVKKLDRKSFIVSCDSYEILGGH